MELLSPAGSREALEAAVQSGADAVYMGFGAFNARRSAKKYPRRLEEAAIKISRTTTLPPPYTTVTSTG